MKTCENCGGFKPDIINETIGGRLCYCPQLSLGEEIAKDLAEWSRKYPRGRIYGMSNMSMDEELVAIETKAKNWLKTIKNA